jgi:hypothetical protein
MDQSRVPVWHPFFLVSQWRLPAIQRILIDDLLHFGDQQYALLRDRSIGSREGLEQSILFPVSASRAHFIVWGFHVQ